MKKGVGSGVGSVPGSGSISQRNGSGDPDPHQNVTDSQDWLSGCFLLHEVSEREYFDVRYMFFKLFYSGVTS